MGNAETVRQRMDQMVTAESHRRLGTQAVIVRTMGMPSLLERCLEAVKRSVASTRSTSRIIVGVVDDSPDQATIAENKRTLRASGIEGTFVSTQEAGEGSFLKRVRDRALTLAQDRGMSEQQVAQAYHYLLTEQSDINRPRAYEDLRVGLGSEAPTNVATLLGAYLLGSARQPVNEGTITHYDHDVLPGETLATGDSAPTFENFDPFAEREAHFTKPDMLFSTGKYTGIAGDPFGTSEIALRVTNGIISDFQSGYHDEVSPYAILNKATKTFEKVSKGEAFQRLPEIIDAFLVRAPITGVLTKDGPELIVFNPHNIKPDGGNITLSGGVARRMPASPTAVHEYSYAGPLRARSDDPDSIIGVETPVLHQREELPAAIDIYKGGLLNGTYGIKVQHQVLLELALAQEPQLVNEILHAMGVENIRPDAIDALPKLNLGSNGNKKQRLEKLRQARDSIARLAETLPEDARAQIDSVAELTREFNDGILAKIEQVLTPSSYDLKDIKKMVIALKRYYIPAIKHWPLLYDAAYQIGLEDAAIVQ